MCENQAKLAQIAKSHFQQIFGAAEVQIWTAPARINIIGEHIDYVSYLPTASLPFGSHEHQMIMVFRPNNEGVVRGISLDERFQPFEFRIPAPNSFASSDWTDFLYSHPTPSPHWMNYVKGAVFYAVQKYEITTGFDFLVASSIPAQGGSSSSSALTVLSGIAARELNNVSYSLPELAQDSAQAEWFIGTRGGALDHTTICLAKRNHAVHLDYSANQSTIAPLPSDNYRWVTFFTQAADKGREVMLEYNERAAVARLIIPAILGKLNTQPIDSTQLHQILDQVLPETISLDEIRENFPATYTLCQHSFPALVQERSGKQLSIKNRALHHLGEIERVANALKLLTSNEPIASSMKALGQLITDTHNSLIRLYEIGTPDVAQLHKVLLSNPGVLGARLIGGGFGGNVLALTHTSGVKELIAQVQKQYYAPQGRSGWDEGAVMVSTPGDGVRQVISV